MSTILQKVVTPQASAAYLASGWDRVAGFVVQVDDVAYATTPAQLFEIHGLGYPGSPFFAADPFVDVLRFPSYPTLQFVNAIGGVDQATRALTGGPFVDRAPFTGTGFATAEGRIVPVWWLTHTRLAPDSVLVRIFADGSSQELARYPDVGRGWVVDGVAVGRRLPRSRFVGTLASFNGAYYVADVLEGGSRVALAMDAEPADSLFVQTAAGTWRREIAREDAQQILELSVEANWNGLELRIVDEWTDATGVDRSRGSYVGHNADLAEGLRLVKLEAGVYEVTLPKDALEDVKTSQLAPASWVS
ncbi:hypothetical protein [Cryobacterium serini]|uniref:Uncharacterized protein n=1 Tax=Cryobacterium serini TaxID=1259201 RepID=A0A4R9BJX8_9MICO|nr:hypothetical protein [Cryobacterium serini]TFD86085.1 hypothetical protein E3T51_13170 [Cryobacterium serini]